jgi:hypothetical protein
MGNNVPDNKQPDTARKGGMFSDSTIPQYPFLGSQKIDISNLPQADDIEIDQSYVPTDEEFNIEVHMRAVSAAERKASIVRIGLAVFLIVTEIFSIPVKVMNFRNGFWLPPAFYVSIVFSGLIIIGGVGILLRQKWGRILLLGLYAIDITVRIINLIMTGDLKGLPSIISIMFTFIVLYFINTRKANIEK